MIMSLDGGLHSKMSGSSLLYRQTSLEVQIQLDRFVQAFRVMEQ